MVSIFFDEGTGGTDFASAARADAEAFKDFLLAHALPSAASTWPLAPTKPGLSPRLHTEEDLDAHLRGRPRVV